MKTLLISGLMCFLCVHDISAQKSFYKHAFVINVNMGTDGNVADQHYFSPPENAALTLNNTALASDYSMGAEYGLLDWLGVGAIMRVDNYYMQQNQLTQTIPTQGAFNIGATANIHLLRWKHVDFLGGYDFGFSRLTVYANNSNNSSFTSGGHWSDIHITGRIYFGRFGANLTLFSPSMTYRNFKASNMGFGDYALNYWKSTGYGASIGLQYRVL